VNYWDAIALLLPAMLLAAPNKMIDGKRSELVIHVGKAGLFSAAGHEHWVDAPIAHGHLQEGDNAQVELAVNAGELKVRRDENTSDKDLAKIQDTMQDSVLESGKYPEIRFRSTVVTPAGSDAWKVTGTLTLHGVSKTIAVDVRRDGETYTGKVRIKQTDFGIHPVSIAGGIVKVKDDLDISFRIRAAPN
jgi:Uncharacterized conserved protein